MFRKYITKTYLYGTTFFFYCWETLAQNAFKATKRPTPYPTPFTLAPTQSPTLTPTHPTQHPTYHPTVNPHLGKHYDVMIVAIITCGIALITAMLLYCCKYRRHPRYIMDSTYTPATTYGPDNLQVELT